MSYSNPSSLNKHSQPSAHPSLPARPPPTSNNVNTTTGRGQITSTNFKPRSVGSAGATGWQQPYQPSFSASPVPPSGYSASVAAPSHTSTAPYSNTQSYVSASQTYHNSQSNGYEGQAHSSYASAGFSRNHGEGYDAEHEAQIAQWQSAYAPADSNAKPGPVGKSENANYTPLGGRPTGDIDIGKVAAPASGVAAVVSGADGSQQTVVRSGGGKTWQDSSLLEWDPSHPRLFIGNLAGEVTDESLLKAFVRYPSLQKAKVVRDKRTSKSKGFGFVSFSSSDDYFQAAKEMQGKYIGSHPVLIKRSTTEIKATVPQQKGKHGKNRGAATSGANLHANTGAGIEKKQPKKKGGLKFLG